jgi:hypothetical protein
MDLKTYAVSQKIANGSNLLDYVVKGESVPLDVVESSFVELLESFDDEQARTLISNYQEYLNKSVPLGIVSLGDHQFKVDGHVSQGVLDAVKLLHNIEPEQVVNDVIEYTFTNLQSGHPIKIESLQLVESSKQVVDQIKNIPSIIPIDEMDKNKNSGIEFVNADLTKPLAHTSPFVIEDDSVKVEDELNKPVDHANSFDNPLDLQLDELTKATDSLSDMSNEWDVVDPSITEGVNDTVPLSDTDSDTAVDAQTEEEIKQAFTDKLTTIYNEFVSELHRLRIPERLEGYGYPVEL